MSKLSISSKISYLNSLLFWVFSLVFICIGNIIIFFAWSSYTHEEILSHHEYINWEFDRNSLHKTQEWLFVDNSGEAKWTKWALWLHSLRFVSSVYSDSKWYYIGTEQKTKDWSLYIFSDISKEISIHKLFSLIGFATLILLWFLQFLLSRWLIRYWYDWLDRLAKYCDSITNSLNKQEDVDADFSLLHGNESQEITLVWNNLMKLVKSLQEYITSQKMFTYGMAHELKTQLMRIQSDVDVAKDSLPDASVLDSVVWSIEEFSWIIQMLLLLAQDKNTLKNRSKESVFLGAILDKYLLDHKDTISSRRISIVNKYKETELLSHPTLVDSIVSNLVSNAIKYCDEWWEVIIDNNDSILSIQNTYISKLSSEELSSMFELFWMKDTSRTNTSSQWLWLALVKKFVDICDRDICVSQMNAFLIKIFPKPQ